MRTDVLSKREREVLGLYAEGLRREEIAVRNGVTIETIKSQLKECRRKLGARTTAHAVAQGFRRGVLR